MQQANKKTLKYLLRERERERERERPGEKKKKKKKREDLAGEKKRNCSLLMPRE